jgi:hypothetical protein
VISNQRTWEEEEEETTNLEADSEEAEGDLEDEVDRGTSMMIRTEEKEGLEDREDSMGTSLDRGTTSRGSGIRMRAGSMEVKAEEEEVTRGSMMMKAFKEGSIRTTGLGELREASRTEAEDRMISGREEASMTSRMAPQSDTTMISLQGTSTRMATSAEVEASTTDSLKMKFPEWRMLPTAEYSTPLTRRSQRTCVQTPSSETSATDPSPLRSRRSN